MTNTKKDWLFFRGVQDNPVVKFQNVKVLEHALAEAFHSSLTPGHRIEDDVEDPEYPDLAHITYPLPPGVQKKNKPRGRSVAKKKALG